MKRRHWLAEQDRKARKAAGLTGSPARKKTKRAVFHVANPPGTKARPAARGVIWMGLKSAVALRTSKVRCVRRGIPYAEYQAARAQREGD